MFRYAELELVFVLRAASLASVLCIATDYKITSASGVISDGSCSIISVMRKTKVDMELRSRVIYESK